MCGKIFDEQKSKEVCVSCPLHKKNCRLVCCPYCQFEMPAEPGWLNSFFSHQEGGSKTPAASLDSLRVGDSAQVIFLNTRDSKKVQNLMAMGVFPGILLTLIQKFPCYVFQLGHSQFAIDHELAKIIFVDQSV